MSLSDPLGNLFNKKPDARMFLPDRELPMSDKYIGIEIEAENIIYTNESLSPLLSYWSVVHDGSLRNYGTEFVSAMLRGMDIKAALEELSRVFTTHDINPDYSDRTSVHIHVDTRFLNLAQLRTLILNYLVLEPYIFSYIGHSRENNSYCIPYYKNTGGLRNLAKLFKREVTEASVQDAVLRAVK